MTHLSYGDFLRQQAQTPGSEVSLLPMRSGSGTSRVVPPGMAVRLLREEIGRGGRGFWLVDGFPRCWEHYVEWRVQGVSFFLSHSYSLLWAGRAVSSLGGLVGLCVVLTFLLCVFVDASSHSCPEAQVLSCHFLVSCWQSCCHFGETG